MDQKQLSKNQLKYLQSLKLKKYRVKYGCFLAEGQKVVKELLEDNAIEIKALYAVSSWFTESKSLLRGRSIELFEISDRDLKRISSLKSTSDVVAECRMISSEIPLELSGWVVFLDGLQDPGNVGTIIRTADWFGCALVAMRPGSVDLFNAKTLQASKGSFARVPVVYIQPEELHNAYPDLVWWLSDLGGEDVRELEHLQPGVLVIGHEGQGIDSHHYEKIKHRLITLPKLSSSAIDSLNAGSATSALLAFLTR